jgi:preprotein translocase subunit YajC
MLTMLLWIGVMFAIVYFLILRPQKQKEKDRRAMVDNVKKGDRIVTVGGIHGEVIVAREKTIVIAVDKEHDVHLKISRAAIGEVVAADETESEGKM